MSLFDALPRGPSGGAAVPFSQEDLTRVFDAKTLQRGRTLIMTGAVTLAPPGGHRVEAEVSDLGRRLSVRVTPVQGKRSVVLERSCTCGRNACAHMAAAAMLALESRPEWRRASLFDVADVKAPLAPPPPPVLPPPALAAPPAAPPPAPATRPAAAPLSLVRQPSNPPSPTHPPAHPPAPRPPAIRPPAIRPGAVPAPPAPPAPAAARSLRWTIEPGQGEVACYILAEFVAEGGAADGHAASPRDVLAGAPRNLDGDADRAIARLLGGGGAERTPVARNRGEAIDRLLRRLLATGRLRWRDGTPLAEAPARAIRAFRDPATRKLRPTGLPERSVLVKGQTYWCVDSATGTVFPVDLQVVEVPKAKPAPPAPPPPPPIHKPPAQKPSASRLFGPSRSAPAAMPRITPPPSSFRDNPIPGVRGGGGDAAAIVERSPGIIARLGRVVTPADGLVDVLRLSFDYGEPGRPVEIEPDDQRQFARHEDEAGAVTFIRRDKADEQAALERLSGLGFAQARIEPAKGSLNARGTRVHWLTGRDVEERWAHFLANEVPALTKAGWTVEVGADFGTKVIAPGAEVEVAVRDAGDGWFDLDVGVEIDGERRPLLPILARLVEKGGLSTTRVIDGRAHIVLDDGNVLALPAERIERLLSVLEAMLDSGRSSGDRLKVPLAEADNLLDIDDLIARRGDETAQIDGYLRRLRADEVVGDMTPPPGFRGELRDYQRAGLAWMQSLRANSVAGILADDMGLGKTAQTLAHIAMEEHEGRLTAPCLVVVPTSLVPNWVAEAGRFTPHLRVVVLHGVDRHGRLAEVGRAHIVVTTYGVVARDVDLLKRLDWHMIVLDEAQAIKNPDGKATRAVAALPARHRLCLSGTPVENNLGELWSQFAFLMPGLLGDRKEFGKRYRVPIEKRGDNTRAGLLMRRIRPFLLRRTKEAVAKELPPKTEVVVRIDLERDQRDLYETIRLSVNETVRAALAANAAASGKGLGQNAIAVIDALLKLRQVCCDPRLLKSLAATPGKHKQSAKLAALVGMVREMVPEGRRILIFSQFTTMLDLIKVELEKAAVPYVELTGRTLDRAEPVNRFQNREVPVFLISLKAGGRGLNLTAADTVIHYDPWWNPAAEDQATDRAYRIGQDKPVFVYKLIAANTVEERILDLQRRKGSLSAATIEGKGLVSALDGGDIDFLLGGGDDDGDEAA
ncbi:DEAD/DEAH box helicase [Azospirillum picis]|uniref:Superfamily II DNA or RNA helicase n=1 Tax=Azospirillum picis TaxID=488438 RepID=A0ABU0MF09_9PROT|nr:DEAD/DEAH box helicase [Azospirillum picis]MBP2298141.1 superfamily II DNA or RNA helicase [Azospirillum picis]MDQ0531979.1 superfamily II DNA or RNA helicase [Azospirillum picis]